MVSRLHFNYPLYNANVTALTILASHATRLTQPLITQGAQHFPLSYNLLYLLLSHRAALQYKGKHSLLSAISSKPGISKLCTCSKTIMFPPLYFLGVQSQNITQTCHVHMHRVASPPKNLHLCGERVIPTQLSVLKQ